jgi:hypothetical protein
MIKQAVILSALLMSGCAVVGTGNRTPVIVRTHLHDVLLNGSMTGLDPDAFYVVVQDRLVPDSAVKISVVPKAQRVILHPAACDEYYVAFDISHIRAVDMTNVYLFHSDRVGNGGILRLMHNQPSGFQFKEVPTDEVADVRRIVFLRVSSHHKVLWFTPKRIRRFVANN